MPSLFSLSRPCELLPQDVPRNQFSLPRKLASWILEPTHYVPTRGGSNYSILAQTSASEQGTDMALKSFIFALCTRRSANTFLQSGLDFLCVPLAELSFQFLKLLPGRNSPRIIRRTGYPHTRTIEICSQDFSN